MDRLLLNRFVIIRFFLLLIPTIAIVYGVLLGYPFGYLRDQNLDFSKSGPDINISEQQPDVNIYVEVKPIPPSGNQGINIQLSTIEIVQPTKLGELSLICIEKLHLMEHLMGLTNASARSLTSRDEPVCLELKLNLYLANGRLVQYQASLENENINNLVLLEDSRPDTFLFPLDKTNSHFAFWLRYQLKNDSGNLQYQGSISPEIYATMRDPLIGWQYSPDDEELPSTSLSNLISFTMPDETRVFVPVWFVHKEAYDPVQSYYTLNLSFTRPTTLLVIYFSVLGAAFFFVFLSIFVHSIELFVQLAIALLFGFFGIRQVVVPQYIESTILTDQIINLLYVYFIVTTLWFLFMTLLRRRFGRKGSTEELSNPSSVSQSSLTSHRNLSHRRNRKRSHVRNRYRSLHT
jgi:hypothetical protein